MQGFFRKFMSILIFLVPIYYIFFLTSVLAAPSGSFSINNGNVFTNSNKITLTIQATGAKTMMISESAGFSGAVWEGYKTTRLLTLSPVDGMNTVYIKFKDGAGNESSVYSKSVYLDSAPPSNVNIVLNNGDNTANDSHVSVTLTAMDATPMQMMLSESPTFTGAVWQSFSTASPFALSAGDGQKSLFAKFKDSAGNESAAVSDSISLDTSSSVPKINIQSSNGYANSLNVNLSLTYNGATEMMLSESDTFVGAVWQTYAASKGFALSPGDGLKTVYAKFKDASGKISPVVSDTAVLDTAAPANAGIQINNGAATTNTPNVQLTLSASGASHMLISASSDFTGVVWENYVDTKAFTLSGGNGTKTVYVKYKDLAGNVSDAVNTSIIFNTTPPMDIGIQIHGGAAYTNNPQVSLALTATGAAESQISEQSDFNDVIWRPSTPTTTFTLSKADGLKIIHARFRDASGNVSSSASVAITLDTVPPAQPIVTINDDAVYTNKRDITLSLSALGANQVLLSESGQFTDGKWADFTSSVPFNLSPGDGTREIYAKFRDAAGNETAAVKDSIILDTAKPEANLTIHDGDEYTNQSTVKFNISVNDAHSVIMELSESPSLDGAVWEPVVKEKSVSLSGGDGTKTIYARFKDAAGNIAELSGTIILDAANPHVKGFLLMEKRSSTENPNSFLRRIVNFVGMKVSFPQVKFLPTQITQYILTKLLGTGAIYLGY